MVPPIFVRKETLFEKNNLYSSADGDSAVSFFYSRICRRRR